MIPFDSVFLAGSAWGCVYYIGVYKGLIQRYGTEQVHALRFGGNSAGAMTALFMAAEIPPEDIVAMYLKLIEYVQKRGNWGMWTNYQEEALDMVLSSRGEEELLALLNKRLLIGVTTFPCKFRVIDTFDSLSHVRRSVHASMMIPWFCHGGLESPFRDGTSCIDGSVSKLAERFSPRTLTVGVYPNKSFDLFPKESFSMYIPPKDKEEALTRIQSAVTQIMGRGTYEIGEVINPPKKIFRQTLLAYFLWSCFLCQRIVYYLTRVGVVSLKRIKNIFLRIIRFLLKKDV